MIGTNTEIVRLRELINSIYSIGQMRLVAGYADGDVLSALAAIQEKAEQATKLIKDLRVRMTSELVER